MMIEANNVSKIFKDFWGRPKVNALRGVSMQVKEGSTFGLLGPNGAGKSTFIKLLLGHLYPTRGTISVLGESPREVDVKKRIGYVPERTSFYESLNAEETLMFFGRLLGLPDGEIKSRTSQLLEMLGIAHAGKRMVGEFSHGMRKRLGLAQALLNDPDLLLLDEPTAGLDPIGCREIKDLILTLGKRGKTVLMTSHLLADVQDVCNEVLILYGGKVQESGPIESLLVKKDEILIKAPAVSEESVSKVVSILEESVDKKKIEVSSPSINLESFFLSIVAEADKNKLKTSGAEMGRGVADYLQKGLDKETLKDLTKPKEDDTPKEEKPEIDQEALAEITSKEVIDKKSEEQQEIDKNALDALTKK